MTGSNPWLSPSVLISLVLALLTVGALIMNLGSWRKTTENVTETIKELAKDKASKAELEAMMEHVTDKLDSMTTILGKLDQRIDRELNSKLNSEKADGELKLLHVRIDAQDHRLNKLETALIDKASGHRVANLEQRVQGIEEELRIVPRHGRRDLRDATDKDDL